MKALVISTLVIACSVACISATRPQFSTLDLFIYGDLPYSVRRQFLINESQKTDDSFDDVSSKENPSTVERTQNDHKKISTQSHDIDEFSELDQVQSTSTKQPLRDDSPNKTQQNKSQIVDNEISRGSQQFMIELFSATANTSRHQGENFVISPYSIWFLMLLIAEGATKRSFNQIQQTLELPGNLTELRKTYKNVERHLKTKSSAFQLDVNQALVFDQNRPINEEYGRVLADEYDADLLEVNFQESREAANIVNGHISKKTHGKIQSLLSPANLANIQLLLTSAIYFKGKWKFPFKSDQTTEEPFYRENGDEIGKVMMMKQRDFFSAAAISGLRGSVLELPYGDDNEICMWLILPHAGATSAEVLDNLRGFSVAEINHQLHKYDKNADHEPSEIVLSLPRFKIETNSEVSNVLQRLGISDIFNPSTAHLEKISKQTSYISRIVHKAIIEVNEEGTVAAAAAGATLTFKQLPSKFTFNRPFHFMIVDRTTNILLFSGQVQDPLQ